jgi:predicted RNase H-like HicB family nuclease
MQVHVAYRPEQSGWSATCVEVPGYTAFGDTFAEVRTLVHEGLPIALGKGAPELVYDESVVGSPASAPWLSSGASAAPVSTPVVVYTSWSGTENTATGIGPAPTPAPAQSLPAAANTA